MYPCEEYPSPPSAIIQHTKRIETLDDFNEAMEKGEYLETSYEESTAYWQD